MVSCQTAGWVFLMVCTAASSPSGPRKFEALPDAIGQTAQESQNAGLVWNNSDAPLDDSDYTLPNFSTTTSSLPGSFAADRTEFGIGVGEVHSTSMNFVDSLSTRTNSTTSFTYTTSNTTTSSTTFLTTTTHSVRCPTPMVKYLNATGLLVYATCIKEQCQEMQKEVLRVASKGRIANCFVLLEGAGGCSGNASAHVAGFSNLSRNFDVGDLCGPLCRSTHCDVMDLATSTSISQAALKTTSAGEGSTSIMTHPLNTQRVWKATLTFRVSPSGAFEATPSVRKALRDSVAAALHVSPATVAILDVSFPQVEDDLLDKENQAKVSLSKVEVPFEIIEAPVYVDEERATWEATLTRLQAHLSKLLYWAGFSGAISSILFEDTSVEYRAAPTDRPDTSVDVARAPNFTVHFEAVGLPGDSHGNRHFKVQFGVFALALVCLFF
eukprot:TRINITY_DN110000_c0_g1_i1.p1 TRINITY_DN110000_c0_g1~~TRINITY_DN110000_c0_g1_i1.p1  ORF type:complete len:439 (-),score=58.10 TRINITY_DN110000_c0_g1_i1:22-1338(-)